MRDADIARLAGQQFNRISRAQLRELSMSDEAIKHRVATGRLIIVEHGVFAVAPVLDHDRWGHWMGATLTAPDTLLSRDSAAAAWAMLSEKPGPITVTRPGTGGPRRHGGLLVFRSSTIGDDRDAVRGIPVTSPVRTVLDLAGDVSDRTLARAVREAVRLRLTTVEALAERIGRERRRRGIGRLAATLARYSGLPIVRARSGAEVRALELLRAAKRPMPRLNTRIAGFEADLSWPRVRVIVEIDGGPFHLDVGADARKQDRWERAGWTVIRVASELVYERPERFLASCPVADDVPQGGA